MLSTMTPFRMILFVVSLAIFINTAGCGNCLKKQTHGGHGAGPSHTWTGQESDSPTLSPRQTGNESDSPGPSHGWTEHGNYSPGLSHGWTEHGNYSPGPSHGWTEHGSYSPGPSQTGYEIEHSDDAKTSHDSHIAPWSETDFEMEEDPIGYGAFGVVRKAKSKSGGKVYAIKMIYKEDNATTRTMTTAEIEREIAIQLNLNNKFIVRLYHAYQSREAFYLQLEMVEGGELFDLMNTVGRFDENKARFYAAEIICGLEYLHKFAIAYRDLKANNVLLTSSGHIKIADFGAAKELGQDGRTSSFRGTPGFMAPEISAMGNQPYGTIVDSWSLGALIYTMIYGWNNGDAISRLSETKINYDGFSTVVADLLTHLLERNPHERYTIAQIKTHKWFRGRLPIDWSQVETLEYVPPYRPVENGYYYTTRGRERFIQKWG